MLISPTRVVSGLGLLGALSLQSIPGAQVPNASPVTFSKDVAPILNARCVGCHQPGEIGPMPLTSYDAARPWARAIRKAVADKVMPPWYADPQFGQFANDPHLSAAEIATIAAWVDGGAVEGDKKDLPAPPRSADGWTIGKPDMVLTMVEPFEVPTTGQRILRDFPIDPVTFKEDTYVERMEIIPSNRVVTHHAIVSVRDGKGGSQRIGGYQPGGLIAEYPKGAVRKIAAGTSLGLNMHYNIKGPNQSDRTKIGLVFAKGPVDQVVLTGMTGTRDFVINPGDPNVEAVGNAFTFEQDSHIIGLLPRMNERGKDFKYWLVYPDGRQQVLLSVPKYNPDWQPNYILKEALAVPKGSKLMSIAHFDNSPQNKRNPDPTARVVYGPEIMNGYVDYTIDSQRLTRSTAQQ